MEREVIFIATLTLVIMVAMIIVLFAIFQSKKNKYILNQLEIEKKMEREIAKSHMEIQEQGLKNIGWELHDNIGQLLAIARMQLNMLAPTIPEKYRQGVSQIDGLIGDSLQEIRSLSKTLNPDVIANIGLVKSIECELERFNKLKFLEANLTVTAEEVKLDEKDEIIIFRILQEFFSNVIKHSKASRLDVFLEYLPKQLKISARDNGIGFAPAQSQTNGSGLINMKSRAHLIGASYSLEALPDAGVHLQLSYNYRFK